MRRWTLDDAAVLTADIPGRGACTDAERRAALALAAEVPEAEIETHWVRPHWAPALAPCSTRPTLSAIRPKTSSKASVEGASAAVLDTGAG